MPALPNSNAYVRIESITCAGVGARLKLLRANVFVLVAGVGSLGDFRLGGAIVVVITAGFITHLQTGGLASQKLAMPSAREYVSDGPDHFQGKPIFEAFEGRDLSLSRLHW